MLCGIFEAHLDVLDLDRSVRFYSEALGLQVSAVRDVEDARMDAHSSGARRFALLWVGGQGHALLGLWERPIDSIRTQHCGFEVAVADLPTLVAELQGRGVTCRDFFQQPTSQPSVFGFIPAASIYFDDPDGHLLELIAPIPGPARPDLGIMTWSEWLRIPK